MKLKTSISILAGCLIIFLFIMLRVFLSMNDKKDESIAAFKGYLGSGFFMLISAFLIRLL